MLQYRHSRFSIFRYTELINVYPEIRLIFRFFSFISVTCQSLEFLTFI